MSAVYKNASQCDEKSLSFHFTTENNSISAAATKVRCVKVGYFSSDTGCYASEMDF